MAGLTSTLPQILGRSGPLPAHQPRDGESIDQGRIYLAPPDCHLHISDGHVRLTGDSHLQELRETVRRYEGRIPLDEVREG